jgi:rhodanese-related sulfurtransferase
VRLSFARQVLLLLGLAFLPAIGQAVYYRSATSWQHPPVDSAPVSLVQAKDWGDAVLWIDARAEDQFAAGHVPGAMRLNEDEWNALLPQVLAVWSPERKLVVYCSRQTCNLSHDVAERLRKEAGLKNVYVLLGGWEEWKQSNP